MNPTGSGLPLSGLVVLDSTSGLLEFVQASAGAANVFLYAWSPSLLTPVVLTVDAAGNLNVTGGGGGGGGAVTVADGADVAQGATTDAAITSDIAGTVSGKLRGLVKIFASVWDAINGRIKVDGSGVTQPVSGSVAVSNFPATQPVSGTVTANAGTGTFAVSAASLPLPAGAATAAKQPAIGTAGAASADVLTVQGVASMTPLSVTGTFFQATQPISAASLPLPTGAATDASLSTIDTDIKGTQPRNISQIGGIAVAATAKGTQASNFAPVQQPKDSGRTYVGFTIDRIAGVTTEALATFTANKGGVNQTAGTTYTVTAGKTLRIQSMTTSIADSSTTAINGRVRVRAVTSGTVVVSSPIWLASDIGSYPGTAAAGNGAGEELVYPDGVEIPGGSSVGISQILSSTSSTLSVHVVGYEY